MVKNSKKKGLPGGNVGAKKKLLKIDYFLSNSLSKKVVSELINSLSL